MENCCLNDNKVFKNKGKLKQSTGSDFFFFLHFLLHKINDKYEVVEKTDFESFIQIRFTEEEFHKLVSLLTLDKEDINYYVSTLEPRLKEDYSDFIRGYNNMVSGRFLAYKYVDQKLVMINTENNKLYLVSGLSEPLSFKIPDFRLPAFITMNLIPLKNMIVYDSSISIVKLKVGYSIMKLLEEEDKGKKYITNFDEL